MSRAAALEGGSAEVNTMWVRSPLLVRKIELWLREELVRNASRFCCSILTIVIAGWTVGIYFFFPLGTTNRSVLPTMKLGCRSL